MKQCKIADKDTSFPDMLNAFYGRFEQNTIGVATPVPTAPETLVPSVTASEIRSVSLGVNSRKATRTVVSPAEHSDPVRTNWWRYSLTSSTSPILQPEVPTCFKKTTIIPVPNKTRALCLNVYHPMALTSIIKKCFKRLVMAHINSSLPTCLNPIQFAYCHNRSIYINRTEVERVKNIKLLEGMITNDLSWTSHVNATIKKAQQCLFFVRQLRKFGMSTRSLTNFYRCTIENILSWCITAWHGNCSAQDYKKLQKVVCTAQTITEANLPSM
eukprot:g25545.t1